jgi:hypothetical protein
MRALVNRRVTNKNVKSNNVLAKFLYPPIFNGDLIVVSDLYVNGTTHLADLDLSGNLYVAQNVDVSGNFLLHGDIDVSGNLDVSGNISSVNSIVAQKFVTGQIANMQILNRANISQATTITIAPSVTTSLFSYSYTPKCASSFIVVEYQTKYAFSGSGADNLKAFAIVNDGANNTVGETYQQWFESLGGGTRSGTIFPIVGRYSNTNKTAKTIRVEVQNNTDADTLTITGNDIMTFLKITEIGNSSTPS